MHAKIRMCNTNTNSKTEHNGKTGLISLTHTYIHTYIKVVGGALFSICLKKVSEEDKRWISVC